MKDKISLSKIKLRKEAAAEENQEQISSSD
jgi:hypothetical protein